MKIDSISINGKNTAFEISEKIFSSDINNKLISQVLYSQIANSKPRLAKTKQRNEIIGSTAKIYAQKGTGGARHSSRKAPLFVGGGVAHGPKPRSYKFHLPRKMLLGALRSALTDKFNSEGLRVVDEFVLPNHKTKDFNKVLQKLEVKKRLLIVDNEDNNNLIRASRNLTEVKLVSSQKVTVYDLLKHRNILFSKSAIEKLQEGLQP